VALDHPVGVVLRAAGCASVESSAIDERGEEWTSGKQPNVVSILGDDIEWFDVVCKHQGEPRSR